MMKKYALVGFCFLLTLLMFTANGHCADDPAALAKLPSELRQSIQVLPSKSGDYFVVLKNGLTILIRQRNEYDAVSAQVFVRAGSMYEGKYLTAGLSHYLEHIVAGGTTRSFTEAEAKARLKDLGGASNAYTSNDRTVYYINTSAEHWKDALDLLTSYVTENVLDPNQVAREKPVIQQEFKLGENNPSRQLWELFVKTAYLVHPVRYPVIGYEDVFVQQNRDALQTYYSERYQPQNMAIALVGKVDPAEAIQLIAHKTEHFVRRAASPVVLPQEPAQTSPRWAEKESPIAQLTQAMIGFPSVSLTDKDIYALDVLAILLGDGETSRLYQRLKEKDKQVLGVDASDWTPTFTKGQFTISLSLPPENWPGVMTGIREEIDRFKTELVDPQELEKAKKKVIAAHVFQKATVSAMASSLASSYFDTGNPYFEEVYVEGIRHVTPAEIREAARNYLDMNRMNTAVIEPVRAGADAKASAPSPAPAAASQDAPKAAEVHFSRLSNGLKLLIKPDHTLPYVTIQLYGFGGLIMEQADKPGLSAFTSSLLTAGTASRSKLDIARAIENVGGGIASGSDNNTYHVSIKVLKEDAGLALDILADIVQNAQFPQDEIEKERHDTLLAIQKQDENWQVELARLFKKNYFKDHPYGHDRLGTPESVNSFSRDDVLQLYHRMVNPGSSVLAVYGDVDLRGIEGTLGEKLCSWKGSPGALPSLPQETQRVDADRTVEKKNEKSSAALFIGMNGLTINDSERPAMDVLDAVLSGITYPSGRLEEALRGGSHDLVYVVHAFPFYGIEGGYFGVVTQTTMGNLDQVQHIIMDNLRRLADEPIPAAELEVGKNIAITMHHLGLESLDAQAQSAAVNEVLGLGWSYDQRYPEAIRAARADEIQKLAKELFAHTLTIRTVPEKPVEILAPKAQAEPVHTQVSRD